MSMNPAELAYKVAERTMIDGEFEGTLDGRFEVEPFEDLNESARYLGLLEKMYVVHAGAALALPSDEEPGRLQRRFDELEFIGQLESYDGVRSPMELGRLAINGVCLTFRGVTLLPFEDHMAGVRLYVPPYSMEVE